MANEEISLIYSQRKNLQLVKNCYKYYKYTEIKSGEIGWKCIVKTCKANLYTTGIDNIFFWEIQVRIHMKILTPKLLCDKLLVTG